MASTMLSSHASAGSASSKVSKKRIRPTKKSPITVLSADASNFKAMVQHLTGIPAGPVYLSSSAKMTMPILREPLRHLSSLNGLSALDKSPFFLSLGMQHASDDPCGLSGVSLTYQPAAAGSGSPFKTGYTEQATGSGSLAPEYTYTTLSCPSYQYEPYDMPNCVSPFWETAAGINCRDAAYLAAGNLMDSVGGRSIHRAADADSNESVATTIMQNYHPVDYGSCDTPKMEPAGIA